VYSYLTAREQKLCRRRAKVEKLLAWKQKLDEEENEIERLEKEAVQGVASRRTSSVNDSIMSGISCSSCRVLVVFCGCLCCRSILRVGCIIVTLMKPWQTAVEFHSWTLLSRWFMVGCGPHGRILTCFNCTILIHYYYYYYYYICRAVMWQERPHYCKLALALTCTDCINCN